MFQNLPLEITLNIARHLEFKDKLKLKRTCRKLNGQIAKPILFEELDLFDSKSEAKFFKKEIKDNDRMIQKLIEDGFDGSLVKVLRFNIDFLSSPALSQLSGLFPNINRVITAKQGNHYESLLDYQGLQQFKKEIVDPLIKWRNNIEKIDTRCDWSKLKSDILLWKYPKLTELDMGGLNDTLSFCIRNPKVSFFQNAPLLTALTLRNAEISVKILETLHTGFPLIQSFRLFYPKVIREKDVDLPASIAPASTVLFLGIYNPREFYKNGAIFDYISNKYANLQRLVYNVDSEYDYSIKTHDDFSDSDKFGIFSDFYNGGDAFEKRVSTEIAKSESNFPIYSAVEFNFFSNLPKSIKALTLRINNIDNAVAALAESDIGITVLDTIERNRNDNRALKNTSSVNCLRNLKSLKAFKIRLDSSVQTSNLESVSFSVTRMNMCLRGDSFSLEWILSMFPCVEELEISALSPTEIRGRFDLNNNGGQTEVPRPRKEYQKLRTLTIMKCTMHSEFFEFAKTSLPHLDELNLKIYLLSSSSSSTKPEKIDLSSWHLNKCNVSFECSYFSSFIRCIVNFEGISKRLTINQDHKLLVPSAKQYSVAHHYDRDIWVEIIWDRINCFKLYGYRIAKMGDNILIDI